MPLSAEQRAERARTASRARWARTTPDERSAHGRAVRTDLDAYVRAVVDRAPELTTDQVARLAAILPAVAVPTRQIAA